MTSGIISLKRENTEFKAGFGLVKQELPGLLQHIPLLHSMEKAYFDTLKYNRKKQSYLLGRLSCKVAISEITVQTPDTIFIDSGIFQFPVVKYVRDMNVQVRITHCDNIGIALAFPEEHPMGIDIEKIDAAKTETLESQITSKEKAMISETRLSAPVGYTMLWTIKESISKVFKTGLMTDFKCFETNSLTPVGNTYESTFTYHGQYKAISHVLGVYVCTIVLPKKTTAGLEEFRVSLETLQ